MSAMKKGILLGAGIAVGFFLIVFGVLFIIGFGLKPLTESYSLAEGEKFLMFEAITYDGTMYMPLDAVSFLEGKDVSVDRDAGKISFGAEDGEQPAIKNDTEKPQVSASAEQTPPQASFEPAVIITATEDANEFYEKYGGDFLLESDKEIVYANSSDEWKWTLYFSSASGKKFEIDRVEVYVFDYLNNYFHETKTSMDKNYFERIWGGTACVERGEKKESNNTWSPASGNDIHYMDYYAYGRDEDGNEIRGCLRVIFSKEVRE